MKRMSPESYKGEAHRRICEATRNLVSMFGMWNAEKIKNEMERLLRGDRFAATANKLEAKKHERK